MRLGLAAPSGEKPSGETTGPGSGSPNDPEGRGATGGGSPDGPVTPGVSSAARDGPGDTYCGNCAQFEYVRTDQGMQPYCGHHDELMDDMDACEEWTPR